MARAGRRCRAPTFPAPRPVMAASSSELRSSSMGSTIAPSSATRHGNVEQADSPRKASNERQSCKRELKRAWPYSRRARTSARGGTCSAQPSPSRTSSSVKRREALGEVVVLRERGVRARGDVQQGDGGEGEPACEPPCEGVGLSCQGPVRSRCRPCADGRRARYAKEQRAREMVVGRVPAGSGRDAFSAPPPATDLPSSPIRPSGRRRTKTALPREESTCCIPSSRSWKATST
jgi:hypothetical protein